MANSSLALLDLVLSVLQSSWFLEQYGMHGMVCAAIMSNNFSNIPNSAPCTSMSVAVPLQQLVNIMTPRHEGDRRCVQAKNLLVSINKRPRSTGSTPPVV
jgi:hypothetical protein